MTDEQAEGGSGAQGTSEERLRALTSDRKPKSQGKSKANAGGAQTRSGDTVDAVRERSNRDAGKDQPL